MRKRTLLAPICDHLLLESPLRPLKGKSVWDDTFTANALDDAYGEWAFREL